MILKIFLFVFDCVYCALSVLVVASVLLVYEQTVRLAISIWTGG